MSLPSRKALIQGLAVFSLLFSNVLAGDKPLTAGIHKDLHGLDVVEIKEVFKRTDYAVIRISPFDLSRIEIPGAEDNTHGVVLEAKAKFHERFLGKGVVTKLNPGSAAARSFFGMFGGGQARVEITCEVIDAASGKVLATMIQARAGTMSGGWGYDRLVQNLCEEVAEDVATLIKQFG